MINSNYEIFYYYAAMYPILFFYQKKWANLFVFYWWLTFIFGLYLNKILIKLIKVFLYEGMDENIAFSLVFLFFFVIFQSLFIYFSYGIRDSD
jgi:hypothetical protein